ncbi:integrase core domain-containing protein [Paenibacillus larvae]|uniref:integrase core domain-containing protein n=1 Tax=Paenibacillus larvae TaxID=1464 RepID=UPI00098ED98D|nr:integrase core domain-containing protein [Paenibacillus larvae]AQZ48076.1 hypothetical protein B5S25_17325 [Paenibacillus larvae subsp. pulvifaciens]MCY9681666.1 integrase core domain-containing protein [Paenibacillus larvae]MEC0185099.1 integrase core domain-containing protein [Paenibacillus larvae]
MDRNSSAINLHRPVSASKLSTNVYRNKNAHIESFLAILEIECYQRHEFESYKQAYEIVSGFIHNYNHNRIHGSIYDMSPYEYMDAVRKKAVEPKTIKM